MSYLHCKLQKQKEVKNEYVNIYILVSWHLKQAPGFDCNVVYFEKNYVSISNVFKHLTDMYGFHSDT